MKAIVINEDKTLSCTDVPNPTLKSGEVIIETYAAALNLDGFIKEVYSPAECTEVYTRLVNDRNFPICVQFDWSRI